MSFRQYIGADPRHGNLSSRPLGFPRDDLFQRQTSFRYKAWGCDVYALTIPSNPPPMPSPSEGLLPIAPLRRRCTTSISSRDLATESRFSRDSPNADTRPSQNPSPTKAGSLYHELGEPEPHPQKTPPSPNVHGALLSRLPYDGAPRDLDPGRTPRTSSRLFERPNFFHIVVHVIVCCAGYPIIYAGAIFAKDKSLFWARVIVGLWCAGVGVAIGWSLVRFSRKYTEAASERTFRVFSSTSWMSDSVLINSWKRGRL